MQRGLIDYKIDYDPVIKEDVPVSKELLQTLIDMTKSVSSTFSTGQEIDFSAVLNDEESKIIRVCKNSHDNPFYCICIKGYVIDGRSFDNPKTLVDNNILIEDKLEDVVATLWFEKLGEVDPPVVGNFVHHQRTTRSGNDTDGNPFTVSTSAGGITALIRSFIGGDNEDECHVFEFTFLVHKDNQVADLWTSKVVVFGFGKQTNMKGLKMFGTLLTEGKEVFEGSAS